MTTFSFEVDFAVSPEVVFDAFWSLEEWPRVARHVTAIEMEYEDEEVQVLKMHVETGARRDAFRTVRIRQGLSIFYFQPAPPPALRRHSGWWHIEPDPGGTRVVSEHSFEIEPEGARSFLTSVGRPVAEDGDLPDQVREVLHHNSHQTMVALRGLLVAASTE